MLCPNCGRPIADPGYRDQNAFGEWEDVCEHEFHDVPVTTKDRYDPALQEGVDWFLIPVIGVPFLAICAIVALVIFS